MDTITGAIIWAVFGLVAGAIARLLMPGRQPMTIFMTMLLGVIGSLAGGFLSFLVMGGGETGRVQPAGWIMSILGAILVLWIYGATTSRRGHTGGV